MMKELAIIGKGGPRLENCFTNLIQSHRYWDIFNIHAKNLVRVENMTYIYCDDQIFHWTFCFDSYYI